MRYCIGCIHWSIHAGEPGHVYSSMTADPDTPAELACDKEHWRVELDRWQEPFVYQEAIEKCMELAETCPDFNERPPHSAERNAKARALLRAWLESDEDADDQRKSLNETIGALNESRGSTVSARDDDAKEI
jgi:hypothetical protein